MFLGTGHGLDVYMAQHRLLPGQPTKLQPSEALARPLLKLMTDQESSQLRAIHFLQSATGCRAIADNDKCHRRDNDIHTAIKKSGLFASFIKILFLTNINKGPWLGGAWLEKKAESLAIFLDNLKHDMQHMEWLMPELAFDKGLPDEAGHSLEVLESLCNNFLNMSSFNLKAGASDMKRFFSMFYSWPNLNNEWTGIKAVLQWLRVQLGHWGIQEIEQLEGMAKQLEQVIGQEETDPQKRIEQAKSKQAALKELRSRGQNTLDVAVLILLDRKIQLHGRIIFKFMEFGHSGMKHDLEQHLDTWQTVLWHSARAIEGGVKDGGRLLTILNDRGFLASLHLHPGISLPNERGEFVAELRLAGELCSLAMHYLTEHLLSSLVHAIVMPFSMAGGMNPDDPEAAYQKLHRVSQDWKAILDIEAIVFEGGARLSPNRAAVPNLAKLLDDLDFHKHQFVREICHVFSEGGLGRDGRGRQPWDPEIQDAHFMLCEAFKGPANTKTFLEDTFRDMRSDITRSGHSAGRFLRMAYAINSGNKRATAVSGQAIELHKTEQFEMVIEKGMREHINEGCFVPPSDARKAAMAMTLVCPSQASSLSLICEHL